MPALLEMNTSPAEPEQVDRKPTMRFQYPSGSRPLDGYTIKRGVGRGGFGEVYFAVSDAGKEVALKLIRRNLEVELRGVTHCLNLKHPNLIDIYDIRTDEHDDRWVVMEYVSGASLEDIIDRYPEGMPREMALHWFEGICAAVAYLHDHGIVHRDLKPANIFLDEDRVKIGDYGLSKFISCSRRSGQTESVGTVHYMAPEIANGRYGREIDAYALGIILYEMLTGSVPFVGESVGEVLMKHLTAEPDLSRLEEPYRSVVRGAMAKDPERRVDSAAEMINILRGVPSSAALNGETIAHIPAANPNLFGGESNPSPFPRTSPPGAPAPGPFTPPVVPNGMYLREFFHRQPDPVWAALVRGNRGILNELGFYDWSPFRQNILRLVAIVLLFVAARVTFPMALIIVAWFIGYRAVRLFVQAITDPPGAVTRRVTPTPTPSVHSSPTPAPAATPVASNANGEPTRVTPEPAPLAATLLQTPSRRKWRRRGQATWRYAAFSELAAQPVRRRATTVLASMLAAAGIAPVAALLACLFIIREFNSETFLWASIVATLASWAILVPGQITEGRVEDQAPLRFTMLLAGALVGIIAWGAAHLMYLDLPVSDDIGFRPDDTFSSEILGWRNDQLNNAYQRGLVTLPLANYAAYFAFLFVVLRWWKLSEWTRPGRVSIWAMGWAGLVAFFVSMVWWFPQPLGIILAAVISFTVQLASPWLAPTRRKQMAQAAATA